jgi:hypothetical protein
METSKIVEWEVNRVILDKFIRFVHKAEHWLITMLSWEFVVVDVDVD